MKGARLQRKIYITQDFGADAISQANMLKFNHTEAPFVSFVIPWGSKAAVGFLIPFWMKA